MHYEARESLVAGMYIMISEGVAARNHGSLLPPVSAESSGKFVFVTDEGHLEETAVSAGMNPVRVVQMVIINAARFLGLKIWAPLLQNIARI